MALLKLKPAFKDYLWGGRRLIDDFGFSCDYKIVAEAWVLSSHPDGSSTLDNGETLSEYFQRHGKELLGTNCQGAQEFPLMIKFIDAQQNLSVQVHPTDEYARVHENQLGKTEMWYVLDAKENAVLYCGFKNEISHEEFAKRLQNDSLLEVLNAIPVKRGDVFFIPAGTIHALGAGVVIAEVQQNSNVTYRLYDYGRGRQLHIAQALDVTNLKTNINDGNNYPHVASCKYFIIDKLNLDGKNLSKAGGVVDEKSFLSVLIIDGEGKISCGDTEYNYRKGDSFLLTANAGEWKICGSCDALLSRVPEK